MPKLMDKNDWIQAVANVSAAERVWSANVTIDILDHVPGLAEISADALDAKCGEGFG